MILSPDESVPLAIVCFRFEKVKFDFAHLPSDFLKASVTQSLSNAQFKIIGSSRLPKLEALANGARFLRHALFSIPKHRLNTLPNLQIFKSSNFQINPLPFPLPPTPAAP
jgi:hypothetical protein